MKHKRVLIAVFSLLLLFGTVQTSQAVLSAVDPGPYTPAFGNFPQWYQDTDAIALDLCLSLAANANGPMCILLADPGFNPALAIAFPGNFPSESFYFAADGSIAAPGITLRYVAALEAAFASGSVVDGQQIVFARIRFVGDATAPGTYVVTHPYGIEVFDVPTVGNRAIAFTRDIGIGTFAGPLKGDIGPFLSASTGLITVGTEQFIGDPNVTQTVVGSPFGTNFLSVTGPDGITTSTDQFTLMGKVSAVVLPTPLIIDRTTYSTQAGATQIDVFATSAPTATLSFTPPATDMLGAAGRFFGQSVDTASLAGISVTAVTPTTTSVTLPTPPAPPMVPVDLVFITKAEYAAGSLLIEAASSDEVTPLPTLTVNGQSMVPTGVGALQAVTLTVPIPPATVTVTSSAGGSDTEDVVILP